LAQFGRTMGGSRRADGLGELRVGDPQFDDWDVVRDFEELAAARAWRQVLDDHGIESVLTADWPLDEFGRGDIALRVPLDQALDAERLLEEP
jgi:hypothetical protein